MQSIAECSATAIFYGCYPDRKAANISPVEVIRYE